jgi:6-phospho-3-hexuloisomerase
MPPKRDAAQAMAAPARAEDVAELRATYASAVESAVEELRNNVVAVPQEDLAMLLQALASAGRIALYGVGREGLAMRGFAMRLHHMGLQTSVVGEMTASAVGPGDLLLLSAGPGYFSTCSALAGEARRAGARVLAFTSQPPSPLQDFADVCIQIPATCLSPASPLGVDPASLHRTGSAGGGHSALPMGSSYELALQLFLDVVTKLLQARLGVQTSRMKATHTNLE